MPATTGKITPAKPRRRTPKKTAAAAADTNASAMFDVTDTGTRSSEGVIEHVPLEHIELAVNPRKTLNEEGLTRLGAMMMQWGQFVPVIGRRVAADRVVVYDGQRRYRAAQRSADLAGTDGFKDLSARTSVSVRARPGTCSTVSRCPMT
ncbi:MAG TPA: ParB N-terminal domain-containing protein [Solirubrobacteraceae bacterium]|nr:ParB N-terminal domain-containing protein [Solirubrobacteraceae bacterium]